MNFWADCRCSPHCVQPTGCAADAETVTHRVFEANGSRLIGSVPIKVKNHAAGILAQAHVRPVDLRVGFSQRGEFGVVAFTFYARNISTNGNPISDCKLVRRPFF
jgi:hypothetical protein